MSKRIIIIANVLGLLIYFSANAQTVNFTGNWKRNDAQSEAGGLSPNSVPITVAIAQDAGQIQIQTVVRDGKGQSHPAGDTLKLDGAVKAVSITSSQKKQVSAKWTDDKHLLYRRIVYGADGNPEQDWKETLSMKGNELEIDVELLYEGENYTLKEVFDKDQQH